MNYNEVKAFDIHDLLAKRWSPKNFDPTKTLNDHEVRLLFEAARWTPSSFNAQPWNYAYTLRGEKGFDAMVETLMPPNQAWAKDASVLILSIARKDYDGRVGSNRFAYYDLGAANMSLITQASAMGLYARQMGGFSQAKARDLLKLEENYDPVAFLAVGYLDPEIDPKNLKRSRKDTETFVRKFES